MPRREKIEVVAGRRSARRVWHMFGSGASLAVSAPIFGVHSTPLTIAGIVCVLIALGGFAAWLPSQKGRNCRGRPVDTGPGD